MSPQNKLEIIELEDLFLSKNKLNIKPSFFKVEEYKERKKERRIDIYHVVVHFLAAVILVPYIAMIIFQLEIPIAYSTIASIVVGFYFARALFP